MIEKGSVCLNGISLTAFNVTNDQFTVAIIPYTYSHTNIQQVQEGSLVNIEFDIIGKYIQRMASLSQLIKMSKVPSVGIAILNWNGRHFLQTYCRSCRS